MKKLLFLLFIAISFSSIQAGNNTTGNREWNYNKGYYPKGNISPEQLPESIKKYLNKNYPDYSIMVCKRQNNGKYFVKVRYNNNNGYNRYRSLVFNSDGSVIKG